MPTILKGVRQSPFFIRRNSSEDGLFVCLCATASSRCITAKQSYGNHLPKLFPIAVLAI
jgi:hypothetical protein